MLNKIYGGREVPSRFQNEARVNQLKISISNLKIFFLDENLDFKFKNRVSR